MTVFRSHNFTTVTTDDHLISVSLKLQSIHNDVYNLLGTLIKKSIHVPIKVKLDEGDLF